MSNPRLRAIHVNAVALGDRIPVMNGYLIAAHDTPKTRLFTVRRPDGSTATRRFYKHKFIYIPWR
jgi:hypothetical protein